MPVQRTTVQVLLLLCCVALCWELVKGGSSFLSPAHKPQGKGKPSRAGRQAFEEYVQPGEDNDVTVSAPFGTGIALTEDEFEEYGQVLQKILQHLLGNTATD
ncbi:ghrelin/obestatin prepropeptide isoform X2 [Lampris incognitus]|uniref:ghrelin/obestatin prepropeptide isoform X2 n=1 Tax=Lampris incognitus TaxID=2546036 RepID=UPI0024B55195|nr:ghrelin/obestatin prepropeptide isoform X2 [Lampris incognitus]